MRFIKDGGKQGRKSDDENEKELAADADETGRQYT